MVNIWEQLRGLPARQGNSGKTMEAAARMRPATPDSFSSKHLTEVVNFGANPGALRMFSYLPPDIPNKCPLMVVLHGCTQTAAGYDLGAGWSTLAKRFGFALVLPEQQRSNNPNGCFNWFQAGDIQRGHGEAKSIEQMVLRTISAHNIDPERVFITGLSAGGAMTSVMLATYPEVFAGGAIIAGLPFGAANNVQQAFETMYRCPSRPARIWGDLVRRASPHKGPWPRISVWHGGADATVIPANAIEIIKQWTDVHGLSAMPSSETVTDGYSREVWASGSGDEVIESYTIPNMTHGTPLEAGAADHQCGVAGPFLLEMGISSSYHIAKFFGLAGAAHSPEARREIRPDMLEVQPEQNGAEIPQAATLKGKQASSIGAIISKALKAAGLMKGD